MRIFRPLIAALAGSLVLAATAGAQGPPPPTAANGAPVQTVAQGVPTPTQFAFGGGTVFAAAGGGEEDGTPGGVFVLKNGTATNLPGSPKMVFGVVWHRGTLYVSALDRILAWSKWNGKKFKHKRVVYKADRKHFSGFTGLAYRDGRLYTGGSFGDANEFKRLKSHPVRPHLPLAEDERQGRPQIVSRGLRQPWQSTFVKGHELPYLTVLSQDNSIRRRRTSSCARRPVGLRLPEVHRLGGRGLQGLRQAVRHVPQHTLPDGISPIGQRLYFAEFGPMAVACAERQRRHRRSRSSAGTWLRSWPGDAQGLGVHRRPHRRRVPGQALGESRRNRERPGPRENPRPRPRPVCSTRCPLPAKESGRSCQRASPTPQAAVLGGECTRPACPPQGPRSWDGWRNRTRPHVECDCVLARSTRCPPARVPAFSG